MHFAVSKHLCLNPYSNEISPGIKFQVPRFQAMKEYGLHIHSLFIRLKVALGMVQAEVNIVVY